MIKYIVKADGIETPFYGGKDSLEKAKIYANFCRDLNRETRLVKR